MQTKEEEKIAAEARQWSIELESEDVDSHVLRQFHAWRDANPRHAEVFEKTDRVWRGMAQMQHLQAYAKLPKAEPKDGLFSVVQEFVKSLLQPKGMAITGMAMACVLAVGIMLMPGMSSVDESVNTYAFTTQVGEVRDFILEDGSVMTLGAHSSAKISFSAKLRKVVLVKGDGLFNVTHNPERPFVVVTGQTETRVLGTIFVVERDGDEVTVGVKEGKVRVGKPTDGTVSSDDEAKILRPGLIVEADTNGKVGETEEIDAESIGAWRTGRLVYENAKLKDIVSDMNRYSDLHVVLADKATEELKLTIAFELDEAEETVDTIAEVLSLQVNRDLPGTIMLGQ